MHLKKAMMHAFMIMGYGVRSKTLSSFSSQGTKNFSFSVLNVANLALWSVVVLISGWVSV